MTEVYIWGTKFSINRGEHPNNWGHEENPHWDNFVAMKKFLSSIGFWVGLDKDIKKKYPSISKDYFEGRYADLKFKADWHPNIFYIEFYQEIIYENRNGGRYDFEKRKKMPYLVGKQYDLTQKRLIQFFKDMGFAIVYGENLNKGEEFIVEDYIRSCHRPQKAPFLLAEIEGLTSADYNSKDRDKKMIYNGDTKYFRGWDGYLRRGKVYHNINNMWWVLLPGGEIRNVASFDLFDLSAGDKLGKLKPHRPPVEYTERKKKLSVCSEKELRNELRRRKKIKRCSHEHK